jgi:GMP synthase (glutamine-hydrolysing)
VKPLVVIRPQESVALGVAEAPLDDAAVPWQYLEVYRDVDWPDVGEVSGLVVLGGEMNVDRIDDYPFLGHGRDLLKRAAEDGVPVLGICLGGQLLARALGADVRPAPVREIGFHPVRATPAGSSDPVVGAFGPESHVFQFHEDAFDLPAGAELLFTGETTVNQAFRYGRCAYGVQFHFEVTERIVAAWCDETPNLEGEWGVTDEEVLAEARRLLPAQRTAAIEAVSAFAQLVTTS